MTFLPPPNVRVGPYTECGACGAWKKEHGPEGECPQRDARWLDDTAARFARASGLAAQMTMLDALAYALERIATREVAR